MFNPRRRCVRSPVIEQPQVGPRVAAESTIADEYFSFRPLAELVPLWTRLVLERSGHLHHQATFDVSSFRTKTSRQDGLGPPRTPPRVWGVRRKWSRECSPPCRR